MHHSPASTHVPDGPGTRRSWLTLAIVAVAQFMVILDVTVVNVALPSIGDSLAFDGDRLQWVVTAYVLFTGGLMLFGGRLADLAGRRPVFLTGLGLFTLASLASGVAWSAESLIVARAVQGIGAAMLLPSALSIVATTYEGAQRAKALAVWGALGSAGAAAGVLLGGVLTDTLGWESIFFINVPVGIGVGARRAPCDRRGAAPGAAPRRARPVRGGHADGGARRPGPGHRRDLDPRLDVALHDRARRGGPRAPGPLCRRSSAVRAARSSRRRRGGTARWSPAAR